MSDTVDWIIVFPLIAAYAVAIGCDDRFWTEKSNKRQQAIGLSGLVIFVCSVLYLLKAFVLFIFQ